MFAIAAWSCDCEATSTSRAIVKAGRVFAYAVASAYERPELGAGAGGGGGGAGVVVVVAVVVVVVVVRVVVVLFVVVGAGAVVVFVAAVVVAATAIFGGDGGFPDAPLASPDRFGVTDTASMKNVDFCLREPPIFSTSDLASAGDLKWIS